MYEDMTPEKIRKRILDRLKTELQTREGSFTNDIIAAAAEEISGLYHALDALVPAFYVDETSGQYIDKQAGTVGIVRKAGTAARCPAAFTGNDGASIPAGAVYYTASGLAFYLEAAVTIREGIGEGILIASEVGDAYNIAAGEIVTALRNYGGVSGFSNAAADGGADPEVFYEHQYRSNPEGSGLKRRGPASAGGQRRGNRPASHHGTGEIPGRTGQRR